MIGAILKTSKYFFLACVIFACGKKKDSSNTWNIISPDSSLQATVFLNAGKLSYIVTSTTDTILNTSPLGITRADQSFTDSLTFLEVSPVNNINEKYTMMTGKQKENINNANEIVLGFVNNNKSKLQVVFRVYNEGIAFKYTFPEIDNTIRTITGENTGFTVPVDGKSWLQNYGEVSNWSPAYEEYYTFGSKIGMISPDTTGWSFPALFKSNNNWIFISESGLDSNYCGTHLHQSAENGLYTIRYPEKAEANNLFNQYPTSTLPWSTPWRFIITGKSLGTIMESNLVHHLAPPQVAGDFSWVVPGRAGWSWWGEHDSPKDFKRLKVYIDFASSVNWEYFLVDANWDMMQNGGNIQELAKYAATKNVKLLLWYNSGGPHTNITERPRDKMHMASVRKEEFKKIKSWGVAGVKVDFFGSDKQGLIKQNLEILQDAADNQILVVFHGCTLPRGWSRTFPNLMSMEAIRGAEQLGWSAGFAIVAAKHNTVVAATRNIVGSMDYTPVTFSDYACCVHQTTNAHELATSIIFESGITHWADRVDSYNKQNDKVKEFMKAVPTVWDITKFVAGEPNELMVLARKSGDDWFVGAINGDSTTKSMDIQLPFISGGRYKMTTYSDGASGRLIEIKESEFVAGPGSIPIKMLPKGGFTAWIRKI